MVTTLDPGASNAGCVLSNGNLTATTATVGYTNVLSTTSKSSGKWYFEVTVNSQGGTTLAGNGALAMSASQSLPAAASIPGNLTDDGIAFDNFNQPSFYNQNVQKTTSFAGGIANGNTLGVCLDFTNTNAWFLVGTGLWNDQPTDDPATNTGGLNDATFYNGALATHCFNAPLFVCLSVYDSSELTVNFGDTAFVHTIPSGFEAWDTVDNVALTGVQATSGIGTLSVAGGLELAGVQASTAINPIFVTTGPNLTVAIVTGVSSAVGVGSVGRLVAPSVIGVAATTGIGPLTPVRTVDGFTMNELAVDTIPSQLGADIGVTMRYSNTGGQSWSNGITRSLGLAGQYSTNLSWRNQGQSRSMVYEISWSCPFKTSLGGATVLIDVAGT